MKRGRNVFRTASFFNKNSVDLNSRLEILKNYQDATRQKRLLLPYHLRFLGQTRVVINRRVERQYYISRITKI